MSTTKIVTLTCDHSTTSSTRACDARFRGDAERVGDVREQAAEVAGWTHKGNEDYCPRHLPDDAEVPA